MSKIFQPKSETLFSSVVYKEETLFPIRNYQESLLRANKIEKVKMVKKLQKRPLAITDLETTGLSPRRHEIIEIGLVLADPETLEIRETWEIKIKPRHMETASHGALVVNNYSEEEWQNAMPLQEAIQRYTQKKQGTIFCAYHVTFDWSFMEAAFVKLGMRDAMEYHRLCIMSMAYISLAHRGLTSLKKEAVEKVLSIPVEPLPHRALAGALAAYEIYKRLRLNRPIEP